MNTKTLVEGGHWDKKGYWYKLYFTLPEFSREKCASITGSAYNVVKVSFPTKISLTNSNVYSNMVISVFGFGIGFEIHSKV